MKLSAVVNALPALQSLAGQRLSLKTLYKVDKIIRQVNLEAEFFNKQRFSILRDCADHVKGDDWKLRADKVQEYQDRLNELLEMEIVDDIEPVIIGADENLYLSYNELQSLKGFVELESME